MTQPLVSVVIPVGPRHAAHCRIAAASALDQSIGQAKVEVIVVGDGEATIAPMPGVTVLPTTGERRGPAHTRNRGIEIAQGQFITFLDADDYLLPRGLEHLLRAYASGKYGYIYGNAYTFERSGAYELRGAPDYVQLDMARYNLHVITTLIPTYQVRQVGGMDERVDAWEDWAFHIRLAMAGICGYRTNQPIFVYRVYEGDRMTRFYGGDPELMTKVRAHYLNEQGVIPMSSCCGGDATLAQIAGQAVAGAPAPEAVMMEGGLVRVEYLGEERGSQTWDYPDRHHAIRLGNNTIDRYKDVTRDQADWLLEHGIPVRVVPKTDPAMPPPSPLPIVQQTDVLTPDAAKAVLRPRR